MIHDELSTTSVEHKGGKLNGAEANIESAGSKLIESSNKILVKEKIMKFYCAIFHITYSLTIIFLSTELINYRINTETVQINEMLQLSS
jgi:hypothetical protein